eukprot:TRINITY_DN14223_c0_g2_i3.p1 TRINITY_DN14223_c0_g2~~TRINITY_DN14223_c0_g2_i3.p1  ORF type:complete len:303 (+),score=67.08 TRINITY_DN14223_c0_g2_i3:145-1053(+)
MGWRPRGKGAEEESAQEIQREQHSQEDEEPIFCGTVKETTQKSYSIDCASVTNFYGREPRLMRANAPNGLEVGSPVMFTLNVKDGRPAVDWAELAEGADAADALAEQVGKKKRDRRPGEAFVGRLAKRSNGMPAVYFIECPKLTKMYGCLAKIRAEDLPIGVELGDGLDFRIEADGGAYPTASHVLACPSAPQLQRKKVLRRQAPPFRENRRQDRYQDRDSSNQTGDLKMDIQAFVKEHGLDDRAAMKLREARAHISRRAMELYLKGRGATRNPSSRIAALLTNLKKDEAEGKGSGKAAGMS